MAEEEHTQSGLDTGAPCGSPRAISLTDTDVTEAQSICEELDRLFFEERAAAYTNEHTIQRVEHLAMCLQRDWRAVVQRTRDQAEEHFDSRGNRHFVRFRFFTGRAIEVNLNYRKQGCRTMNEKRSCYQFRSLLHGCYEHKTLHLERQALQQSQHSSFVKLLAAPAQFDLTIRDIQAALEEANVRIPERIEIRQHPDSSTGSSPAAQPASSGRQSHAHPRVTEGVQQQQQPQQQQPYCSVKLMVPPGDVSAVSAALQTAATLRLTTDSLLIVYNESATWEQVGIGAEPQRIVNACLRVHDKFTMEPGRVSRVQQDAITTTKALTDCLELEVLVRTDNYIAVTYYWQDAMFVPLHVRGAPASIPAPLGSDAFHHLVQEIASVMQQSFGLTLAQRRFATMYKEAMKSKIRQLDQMVQARGQLMPQDNETVQDIGYALSLWLLHGGYLDREHRVEVVLYDGQTVMWRYQLYDGEGVQIRLHLFPDASETYIHNHRANLISMCLNGQYDHLSWQILSNQRGTYTQYTRDGSGAIGPKQVVSGSVKMTDRFKHVPGHVYFLRNDCFHMLFVLPPTRAEEEEDMGLHQSPPHQPDLSPSSSSPFAVPANDREGRQQEELQQQPSVRAHPSHASMLTLFIKDKQRLNTGTRILEPAPESIRGLGITAPPAREGAEIVLEGTMKAAVLNHMERITMRLARQQTRLVYPFIVSNTQSRVAGVPAAVDEEEFTVGAYSISS